MTIALTHSDVDLGGGAEGAIAPPSPIKKYRGESIFSQPQSFGRFLGSFTPRMRLQPGLCPDPAAGAYSTPPDPVVGTRGSLPTPQTRTH